jgi:hypothetical protein
MLVYRGPNAEALEEFVARAVMLPRPRLEEVERRLAELASAQRSVDEAIDGAEHTHHAEELRRFIHQVAYDVVRLRDEPEMMNPKWIAEQLYPTARALLVRTQLQRSADIGQRNALTGLTELFPDILQP